MEIFLTIIGTLITIYGTYLAYKANVFSKRVSLAEGVFDKPKLSLEFEINDTIVKDLNKIVIAVPIDGDKILHEGMELSKIILIPFKYIVGNKHSKSIKNVKLMILYSDFIHPSKTMGMETIIDSPLNFDNNIHKETHNKKDENGLGTHIFSLNLDDISPNTAATINDMLMIRMKTRGHGTELFIQGKTYNATYDLAFPVDISIIAEDFTLNKIINVEVWDTSINGFDKYELEQELKIDIEAGKNVNGKTLFIWSKNNVLIKSETIIMANTFEIECIEYQVVNHNK